ncbi:MAG TPA: S41 family peptidase [Thermoanaerobaculia bacterium]
MKTLAAVLLGLAVSLSAFAQAPGGLTREQLDVTVDETLTLIEKNFMKTLTREEIVARALNLLLQDLDPYSRYLNPIERADFEAGTKAQFAGVGVIFELDAESKLPRVRSLMLDSAARDAGVQRGDLVISVDGHALEGWPMDQIIGVVRGEPGAIARFSVRRAGVAEPLAFNIKRRIVLTPSVRGVRRDCLGRPNYLLDDKNGIGYIRVSRLAADTVGEVDRAVAGLQKRGLRALILDLRDCTGGLMRSAVDTADLFIDSGKLLTIVDRQETEMFEAAPGKYTNFPMIVLINAGTVSSGEILAGALKDSGRATFIGQRTFGKGRVQVLFPLGENLGAVVLSTGTFQRPSGKTIDRHDVAEGSADVGIAPDDGYEIFVADDEYRAWLELTDALDSPMVLGAEDVPQNSNDRVLHVAVETLVKKLALP